MKSRSQSIEYIDYVRVFAAAAVLLLHVFAQGANICGAAYFSRLELFIIRIIRNSLNWCVPVFVMITGALFLNPQKDVPIKKLFSKYIRRFVVVILTFGTLYCLMEVVYETKTFSVQNALIAVKNALIGKSWDAMWYLYMAVWLYCLLPLLKKSTEHMPNELLQYGLLVIFVFSSVIPYIQNFVPLNLQVPEISIYIFYVLLGYAVHYRNIELKNSVSIIFIAAYVIYLAAIQLNSEYAERILYFTVDFRTEGYHNPLVVALSWAVFSLCKRNIRRASKIIDFLAPLTFGVYILHTVSLNVCYRLLNLTAVHYPLIVSFGSTAIITVIWAVGASYLLRLIPFVRKNIL
ncbi:MAG: acyltransferase [Treponema sp.]